jgi:hypothetical protein
MFSNDELEVFAVARTAGAGLRKTFDSWIFVGCAVQVARRHADVGGGSAKKRNVRLRAILEEHDLARIGKRQP